MSSLQAVVAYEVRDRDGAYCGTHAEESEARRHADVFNRSAKYTRRPYRACAVVELSDMDSQSKGQDGET